MSVSAAESATAAVADADATDVADAAGMFCAGNKKSSGSK